MFCHLFPRKRVTRFGLTKLDTMAKEKFRVCEHIMPGDVEISSNGGFKQEHVGSCRLTTKNISLLPCLWPPNMMGWCHDGLPPIKSDDPLITWSSGIAKQTKLIISHYNSVSKLASMETILERLLAIKSNDSMFTWSSEVTRQTKNISIKTTPVATKLGSRGLARSCDKLKASPLLQCLWPPNLAGWWLAMRGYHPLSHMIFWSRDLKKSRDKLKHLHYYNSFGHQIWQDGDLLWVVLSHKVT